MQFNRGVFAVTFTCTLAILFPILWTAVELQGLFTIQIVVSAIVAALAVSLALAWCSAIYEIPIWATKFLYRRMLSYLAKKAIRSSLSHAATTIECSGILEIDNEVALRVQAGTTDGIAEGSRFNVYESTNNQLWGRVEAVSVRYYDCDCTPYDRGNVEFWEQLEGRMRYNTEKPPNVHLVRDVPIVYIMEQVENLLGNWR